MIFLMLIQFSFLIYSLARRYQAPPLDPIQNIHNMSVWRENGVTSLKFNRKRRTGDKNDFQFSDTNCPYFVFPVQGGVFNAVNKRLRKHELTPIVSESRICVRTCRPATPSIPTTTVAPSTSSVSTTVVTTAASSPATSPPTASLPGAPSLPKLPADFDYSQLGLPGGLPDLGLFPPGKMPPLPAPGSPELTSFLESMNMTGSDIPSILKTLAARYPSRNESAGGPKPAHPTPPKRDEVSTQASPSSSPDDTPALSDRKKTTPKATRPTSRVRTNAVKTTSTTTTSTTPSTTSAEPTTTEVEDGTEESVEESNYVVELKLPRAWKSAYGRRESSEYKKFRDNVEDQVRRELEPKISGLDVKVMELTGVEDANSKGENSVIAKLQLTVRNDESDTASASLAPVNVTEALNLAIQDGRLGDVAVDASYLIVRPYGKLLAKVCCVAMVAKLAERW